MTTPATEPTPTEAPTPTPAASTDGFPANTPIAEMNAEQQAAYWKHQARKHEERVKSYGDVESLRAKAEQFERLEAASRTEHENALLAARAEARQEALREATPRLVAAEFRAAAKGRLTTDQVNSLLEDLDLSKYVTDKGDIDLDRVEKKIAVLAPEGADAKQSQRFPDLGQGPRGGHQASGAAAGLAEAQRRFGIPAGSK